MQEQTDQIQSDITRVESIVNGLKGTECWNAVLEDSKRQAESLDTRWCWCKDTEEFQEMRVTKMAILYILDLVSMYERELEVSRRELNDLVSADTNISKDVDNE